MIERFENEYPECRVAPAAAIPNDMIDPDTESTPPSSLVDYPSEAFGTPGDPSSPTDAPSEDSQPIIASISRHPSDTYLASRQAAEEGRMHRFGQQLRRDVLRPQTLDYAHGTTGDEPEAQHLAELRERCETITGEEIRKMYTEMGVQGMLNALGTTAEELELLEERDPAVREGRVGELLNLERMRMQDETGSA